MSRWALWLMVLLSACRAPPPDEQRLRDTLDALQLAGEERRFDDLLDHVAEDFAGPSHVATRAELARFLRLMALRMQSVAATRLSTDIQMFPAQQRATVNLRVLLRGDAGGLLPEARELAIESAWKVEDGEWRVIRAEWR